ncbi:cytochrome c biogenesis protein CcdA [Desulfococcaceae bacterium OttesenSCG-928-F15]|nr:cytochrome c biogenesis protein CcdA [Desulfococcaceae bacterium OttesenSCG-928-F15]
MFYEEPISFLAAFSAGLLSFFSPCILPLIPAYFCFISGVSMDELVDGKNPLVKRSILISTLGFVLGFSLVFVALGASVSFLGQFLAGHEKTLRIVGGVLILLFGLHLMGILKVPFLMKEKKFHMGTRPVHAFAAFFIGMAFAAGWSPCVGPLLGSILALAGMRENVREGALLLSVYAAGLAIPFLVLAATASKLLVFMKKVRPFIRFAGPLAGILLVGTGILLITDQMKKISFFLS